MYRKKQREILADSGRHDLLTIWHHLETNFATCLPFDRIGVRDLRPRPWMGRPLTSDRLGVWVLIRFSVCGVVDDSRYMQGASLIFASVLSGRVTMSGEPGSNIENYARMLSTNTTNRVVAPQREFLSHQDSIAILVASGTKPFPVGRA